MRDEYHPFPGAADISGTVGRHKTRRSPKAAAAVLGLLLASPAFAQEAKPPLWVLAVQLKSSLITVSYSTETVCREAAKLMGPSLKKLGRADCLPVHQQ